VNYAQIRSLPNGVHGALLIGKRYVVAARQTDWKRELATFEVELYCDSRLMQRGGGSLVLDSPLAALRHLIELLASDPHNPPLRTGEIISTGTLTLRRVPPVLTHYPTVYDPQRPFHRAELKAGYRSRRPSLSTGDGPNGRTLMGPRHNPSVLPC
jgi:hypothetical protein